MALAGWRRDLRRPLPRGISVPHGADLLGVGSRAGTGHVDECAHRCDRRLGDPRTELGHGPTLGSSSVGADICHGCSPIRRHLPHAFGVHASPDDGKRSRSISGDRPSIDAVPAVRPGSMLGKLGGLVLCIGLATYLRPQSVLMAPVLGWLGAPDEETLARAGAVSRLVSSRLASAILVTIGVLACTAPWVARNCDKMDRCLFVSANGGWNLLIGTFPEGQGAWVSLDGARVPVECREVYGEAEKDACFQTAGVRRIRASVGPWIKLFQRSYEQHSITPPQEQSICARREAFIPQFSTG